MSSHTGFIVIKFIIDTVRQHEQITNMNQFQLQTPQQFGGELISDISFLSWGVPHNQIYNQSDAPRLACLHQHLSNIVKHWIFDSFFCQQAYLRGLTGRNYVWILMNWAATPGWPDSIDTTWGTPPESRCNTEQLHEAADGYLGLSQQFLSTSKEPTISGMVIKIFQLLIGTFTLMHRVCRFFGFWVEEGGKSIGNHRDLDSVYQVMPLVSITSLQNSWIQYYSQNHDWFLFHILLF